MHMYVHHLESLPCPTCTGGCMLCPSPGLVRDRMPPDVPSEGLSEGPNKGPKTPYLGILLGKHPRCRNPFLTRNRPKRGDFGPYPDNRVFPVIHLGTPSGPSWDPRWRGSWRSPERAYWGYYSLTSPGEGSIIHMLSPLSPLGVPSGARSGA